MTRASSPGSATTASKCTADVEPLLEQADGLARFHDSRRHPRFRRARGKKALIHVIGTTGLTGENDRLIAEAAKRAAIVKSGNMSMGVNLLAALVKQVARTLGDEFDVEILEMHHNKKVDAPSGTALMLGAAAAHGRGIDLAQHSVRGPRRSYRRALCRRYRLRVRCAAVPSRAITP